QLLGRSLLTLCLVGSGCAKGLLPTGISLPLTNPTGGNPAVNHPTPPIAPDSPPDLVVAPPSGAPNPIPLQPPTSGSPGSGGPVTDPGGAPIGYPGGGGVAPMPYPGPGSGMPVPYPGGGGGSVPSNPASGPVTNPGAAGQFLPDQEAVVLMLTNQARAQAGVPPLSLEAALTTIAEGRSQDMGTRQYFSHVNPDGQTVFDLLTAAGIAFTTAGENIAMNSAPASQTAQTAFTGWMSDSGHKGNILNAGYGHLGIGVYQTAGGVSYLTQDFTN
ncbi:MAG: hypothetical protein KGR26_15695, partial [Cyanobacteria bacterium REEB65]|nr:hypothetical protein [Cyanobacteria bacterium REEB65]